MRQTKKHPPEPPPDTGGCDGSFGLEFTRTVSNLGIRFIGFQYTPPAVQTWHGKEVIFRAGRYDVSLNTAGRGSWDDVAATQRTGHMFPQEQFCTLASSAAGFVVSSMTRRYTCTVTTNFSKPGFATGSTVS